MVIGIDPSLTATGVCLLQHGKAQLITINSFPGDDLARITEIAEAVGDLLFGTPKPIAACIEGLSHGSHNGKAAERASLHYFIRAKCRSYSIPVYVVAPASLKKFITGGGKAEKSTIVREVYKRWGIEANDDNQADAAGLAYVAAAIVGEYEPANTAQREVVAKLTVAPVVKVKRRKTA